MAICQVVLELLKIKAVYDNARASDNYALYSAALQWPFASGFRIIKDKSGLR